MKINKLLVVALSGVLLAGLHASCTYDYFVDETNYKVYVPEVANGQVSDCYVAVYDERGHLVRVRRTGWPGDSDPRAAVGIFSFHLPPGKYTTYCYANVGDMQVTGSQLVNESFFAMKELAPLSGNPRQHAYAQPPDMIFQKLTPEIGKTLEIKVDTTALEKYVGRITVRFKNMPVSMSQVARVQLEAMGVATQQYFHKDTLTSRFTKDDYLFDEMPLSPGATATAWELDRRYFPSIEGQMTRLNLYFIGASGEVLCSIPVEVIDMNTGLPLPLLHGQHLVIEVDNYLVIGINLVGWDEGIKGSDREI
jgi:hypothetical protein